MKSGIRIAALISGGGTNLQAVIDACEQGRINGDIVCVGSDRADAAGLERARKHGLPIFVVDYGAIIDRYRQAPEKTVPPVDFDLEAIRRKQAFPKAQEDRRKAAAFLITRSVAEACLLEHLLPRSIDLLILAGFMRNLSPYFIDRFNIDSDHPRIMNIHPALLPAFPGLDGYGDTLRYGCKVGGCTVHFVDYGEDTGPIIGQKSFAIETGDTLDTVRKKGLAVEWQLYPECIQMFAQGRLHLVTMTHTLPGGRLYQRRVVEIARQIS
jgi:phosphoribosylglycinamide formyltransferase 1